MSIPSSGGSEANTNFAVELFVGGVSFLSPLAFDDGMLVSASAVVSLGGDPAATLEAICGAAVGAVLIGGLGDANGSSVVSEGSGHGKASLVYPCISSASHTQILNLRKSRRSDLRLRDIRLVICGCFLLFRGPRGVDVHGIGVGDRVVDGITIVQRRDGIVCPPDAWSV